MNILPRKTQLGYLQFYEIYDDAFGPKCFSVKNELEHLFLVYWSGSFGDGQAHDWVYIPVSHSILDKLRREELTFHQAFSNSMRFYYVTTFGSETEVADCVKELGSDEIEQINLPPKGFKIKLSGIKSVAPESKWDFNLKIAKKSSSVSPQSNIVTRVMDAFGDVVESLMYDESHKYPRLMPLSASYGSFDIKLGSSSNERAAIAIEQLHAILSDVDSLDDKLDNLSLDPYKLKSLLDLASMNHLKLTIKPKTSEYFSNSIDIVSSRLKPFIDKLEESTVTLIDSRKVPQANSLDRVIEIVKLRVEGGYPTIDNVDGLSSKRQISYYTHAAWCLGLLNKDLTVAAPGRLLCHKNNKIAEYQYLAGRFESSEFGWAWMRWAKVTDIGDLDPASANEFVRECVKGLNDATSKRRATSLSSWLSLLKAHRREYSEGDEYLD